MCSKKWDFIKRKFIDGMNFIGCDGFVYGIGFGENKITLTNMHGNYFSSH